MSAESKKTIIAKHVELIMEELGIVTTPSNFKTPQRVAKMYVDELFSSVNNAGLCDLIDEMTCFDAENKHMVIMRGIEFHSMCEHHLLPFSGKMTIGYVPNCKVVGLSKIPRAVKYFCKKPQLQERLVKEIADFLYDTILPQAVFVIAEATHCCVMCRGVESSSSTETYYSRGIVSDSYKDEFLTRAYGRR